MMRIITGRARGTQLATLPGEATRPTSERAKEAVFSALQFELRDRTVLDLFAGSGQMGLEALSRGAASAVLVDAAKDAVSVIETNVRKTHFEESCRVVCADYADFLRRTYPGVPGAYDLVILDPPYAKGLLLPALGLLLEHKRLLAGALIVCESAQEDIFAENAALAARFSVRKKAKYGVAYMTLLEWTGESDE